jgi:predicted nucleotidyltransferase
MRLVRSSGSAKSISLKATELIRDLRVHAESALEAFPEIRSIHLFGSLAAGRHTGLSDIDLLVVTDRLRSEDPLEAARPHFVFFSERLRLAVDVLVARDPSSDPRLHDSIALASRAVDP